MDSTKIQKFDRPDAFPVNFKYTPLEALRNLFVGFAQGLFHEAPPGSYHWDPDPAVTEIVVQDEAPVKEEVMQRRPLVVFTRGPIQFYSFGMDDLQSYNAQTSKKTKSILVPGTMTANCCSRVALEAENIAWIVAEHIWLLRDLLIEAGLFDVGRQIQLGSPSPAGSIISDDNGDKWTAVPVSVPFQFVRTSARTPLGQRVVNNLVATFSTRLQELNNLGPPLPSESPPVNVQVCPAPPLVLAADVRGGTPAGVYTPRFTGKQYHPLYPTQEVTVRTVRPYKPGLRTVHPAPMGAVPIPAPCVEESSK